MEHLAEFAQGNLAAPTPNRGPLPRTQMDESRCGTSGFEALVSFGPQAADNITHSCLTHALGEQLKRPMRGGAG